ncbi:hypothetical protein CDD83_10874 [Cordyceps sp. RAO-2017]|nr:hypothetical protein CDD83_10874 [Cordyceps sp. RAO-2017]
MLQLQGRSPNLVDLSRLQLALQGLRQGPGHEVVRIAILALDGASDAGPAARKLLRSLLADPLGAEEAWERELEGHDADRPLIVRVAPVDGLRQAARLHISSDTALDELHVSSPALNGLNLEFLLTRVTVPRGAAGRVSAPALEDALLVPTVDIPSGEQRTSPVTTPVHQALLVADGLDGAVDASALLGSDTTSSGSVRAAVQLEGLSDGHARQRLETSVIDVIDATLADRAVQLFRQSPRNAMEYEHLWFASNLPRLVAWLKAAAAAEGEATKPAVRRLVASLLQRTLASVQAREAAKLAEARSPALDGMERLLAQWAQRAHAELQDELDLAFTGRPWRKLGWWKLFWRVDDVAMLTNDMLSRRFMPTAEQELVYLAGQIAQAGRGGDPPPYPQPVSSRVDEASRSRRWRLALGGFQMGSAAVEAGTSALPKWPGHIAFTRRYLQNETVPALQSLAQKLVFQALGTSGLTTSLAALFYASSLSSTLYEAGAVAALGIVYSLGRMQKKWEAARSFWEGEVREEGRKAVRGAEESVASVLQAPGPDGTAEDDPAELDKARELVAAAEDALARMR